MHHRLAKATRRQFVVVLLAASALAQPALAGSADHSSTPGKHGVARHSPSGSASHAGSLAFAAKRVDRTTSRKRRRSRKARMSKSGPPRVRKLPAISGSAQEGQTLSVDSGSWSNSPTAYSYQWLRCDAAGANCAAVAGATAATYVLSIVDVGSTMRARVTATNRYGSSSATSAATAVVTALPPEPTPTETPTTETPPSSWSPIWSGAFETGDLSEYYQVLQTSAGPEPGTRITLDTVNLLSGRYSARFELRPGDTHSDGSNRIQLRGVSYGNHYFDEGEDWYFRWGIYVDPSTTVGSSISNPWRAVVAWPSVQDGAFSPLKYFVHREANGGASPSGTDSITMAGDLGVSGAWDTTQWKVPVVKGQWYQFITHWKFSSDPSVGLVEHWMKAPGDTEFIKQTFLNGSQTMHMKTLSGTGAQSNLRVGIYRNKSFTTVDKISYDDVYAGSTLASVLD